MDVSVPPSLDIARGTCYQLLAYDIARFVDLDEAERHINASTQREVLRHRRRAPKYFAYHPRPLRVTLEAEPIQFGTYLTSAYVDVVLYDFGGVLVVYTLPLSGKFSGLLQLSNDLYEAGSLQGDSRQRVAQLMEVIQSALVEPSIADFVEDYAIFHIEEFLTPPEVPLFCTQYATEVAQILRAELRTLSTQEVTDALTYRISYGISDITIVDWNAALMIDPEGDDVRAVLEFANVELLEMRYLDRTLDTALDRAYEAMSRRQGRASLRLGRFRADLRRIARMQVDSAVLFEGVNNALKLLGDQYLSRLYRLVSQRFHLAEWDAGILRKLQTLESIYEKMSDQVTSRRMEVLEWIIIILIAISIMLPFVPGGYGH